MESLTNAANDNIPITEHIDEILILLKLTEHIHIPVTPDGCTLECYKDLMELPAVCTVEHASFCECKDPDILIVQQYLKLLYVDKVEEGLFTSDGLRTFQWLIHELCEEFAASSVGAGFEAPENVPDPR